MASYAELSQSVIAGQDSQVKEQVNKLLEENQDPMEIISQGLIAGMNEVGIRFKAGDMFVPEVLMAARAMTAGLDIVKPLITNAEAMSAGKVIIGTVKGDLHDIGKNMVAMMFEGAGYTVINLGTDVSPEKFVAAVKEYKPHIVGMSSLLTTTMMAMKDTIEALKEEGVRNDVKVIIGGTPITQDFADEIGADAYAPDATTATDLAKELLSA